MSTQDFQNVLEAIRAAKANGEPIEPLEIFAPATLAQAKDMIEVACALGAKVDVGSGMTCYVAVHIPNAWVGSPSIQIYASLEEAELAIVEEILSSWINQRRTVGLFTDHSEAAKCMIAGPLYQSIYDQYGTRVISGEEKESIKRRYRNQYTNEEIIDYYFPKEVNDNGIYEVRAIVVS